METERWERIKGYVHTVADTAEDRKRWPLAQPGNIVMELEVRRGDECFGTARILTSQQSDGPMYQRSLNRMTRELETLMLPRLPARGGQ